ncbi:MAG: hypothetical protein GYB35_12515 [Algicola sp.]|nr:hypothetical protein [Algicola sp.]
MNNQRYYICAYCVKEFEPKRRGVQKYCSNSCRSKAYYFRLKHKNKKLAATQSFQSKSINKELPKEKMSIAGVGNAAAGSLLAESLKSVFTSNSKKPATKGDILTLLEKLQGRYHLVKNIPVDQFGRRAYFDLTNSVVVYF